MSQRIGGWDVHMHIVPPAVVAADESGAFGMRAGPGTLTICAHGVPLHPLSEIDRVQNDDLDALTVSVPLPLFRPDLNPDVCGDYARLVNDGLHEACREQAGVLRPLAYLPAEALEIAVRIAAKLEARIGFASAATDHFRWALLTSIMTGALWMKRFGVTFVKSTPIWSSAAGLDQHRMRDDKTFR